MRGDVVRKRRLSGELFVLTRRTPKLLLRLPGSLLLRFAERTLAGLLFQLPPRFTRLEPLGPSSQVHHCRKPLSAQCQGIGVNHVADHAAHRARKQGFVDIPSIEGQLSGRKVPPESCQPLLWQPDGGREYAEPKERDAITHRGKDCGPILEGQRQTVMQELPDLVMDFVQA